MKKEKEITLKDALTYGDNQHADNVDVHSDSNDSGEVKEESYTPLEVINGYLGIILNKLISIERLVIVGIILAAINFIIWLCIIIL